MSWCQGLLKALPRRCTRAMEVFHSDLKQGMILPAIGTPMLFIGSQQSIITLKQDRFFQRDCRLECLT